MVANEIDKSDNQPEAEVEAPLPLYNAKDHDEKFDPVEYLEGFYKTAKEDLAMQIVLFFLPGMLYRLPNEIEDILDLGAGPTVYIPIAMRHRARNIYSSDYAKLNREMVASWIKNESKFDWSNVCEWIKNIEASKESPEDMQALARQRMRAVLDVNVHRQPPVQGVHYAVPEQKPIPSQFDAVCTVFCLEYASETLAEYERAVGSAASLVKTGGYLVQGGCLEADEYCFGGRRFKCHFLTKDQLLATLKANGFETSESPSFKFIEYEGVFLLVTQKLV